MIDLNRAAKLEAECDALKAQVAALRENAERWKVIAEVINRADADFSHYIERASKDADGRLHLEKIPTYKVDLRIVGSSITNAVDEMIKARTTSKKGGVQ